MRDVYKSASRKCNISCMTSGCSTCSATRTLATCCVHDRSVPMQLRVHARTCTASHDDSDPSSPNHDISQCVGMEMQNEHEKKQENCCGYDHYHLDSCSDPDSGRASHGETSGRGQLEMPCRPIASASRSACREKLKQYHDGHYHEECCLAQNGEDHHSY